MVVVWLQLTVSRKLFWGRSTVGKKQLLWMIRRLNTKKTIIFRLWSFPEIKDQIFQVDEMECVLDSAHRAFREREQPKERLEIRSVERREKRESLKVRFIFIQNIALSHMITHFSIPKRNCNCRNEVCLSWWFTLLPYSSSLICPYPLDYLTYPLTYFVKCLIFPSASVQRKIEGGIFDFPEREAIGNHNLLLSGTTTSTPKI